jgi:hypothetical protein
MDGKVLIGAIFVGAGLLACVIVLCCTSRGDPMIVPERQRRSVPFVLQELLVHPKRCLPRESEGPLSPFLGRT